MIETMYRKILIPTDGSVIASAAAGYGIELAEKTGATATALSVIDVSHYAALPMNPDTESPLYRMSREAVDEVVEAAAGRGVRAEGMVVEGMPKRDIVVVSHDHDLIVMGTTGRTGMAHLLLGSVADKVIRQARVPVIVIRSSDSPAFRCEKVLIATDGTDSVSEAVSQGLKFAKSFGATVTVLCVSDDIGMTVESRVGEPRLANVAVNDVIAEGRKLGMTVEPRIIPGSPEEVILQESKGYDLLVMGTHGRSGLDRFRMGSVAERVVRHSLGPVLIARGIDI